MDYLVADPTLVPSELRHCYQEKLIYLPSYQVNDSKRPAVEPRFTREEFGLPAGGFVFCCFNGGHKITPSTFSGWMRILRRTAGSVLFLYGEDTAVAGNLRSEAARRGVDPDRLVFGGKLSSREYLARYRTADLFLDTLPYNAGTTASDALWAGLPVLTCMGQAFAGRVAASILAAMDLPELIASTQEQYEDLAVEFATQPGRLAGIRHRLLANRLTAPLFDTARFTRNLEYAYEAIYDRYLADQAPQDIHIDEHNSLNL
jgi:protein O-GlcNAc transferase